MEAKPFADLNEVLPEFKFDTEFCADRHPEFDAYRKLYGFDTLQADCERYCFGALELGQLRIASHYWQAAEAKANVLLVHGLFDHVGLFLPLVRSLLQRGYSVFAIDLQEHGISSGQLGLVRDFSEYTAVVDALSLQIFPKVEGAWYAIAQSTGAAVLMQHLLRAQVPVKIEKAVLFAPLIKPRGYAGVLIAYWLLHLFLSRVKRGFTINSHDADFCHFLKNIDPLQARFISVNWVGAMLKWVRNFKKFPSCDTPTLIVQGTSDLTVSFEYNLKTISEKFKRLEIEYIEDAMHHLAREGSPYREQVLDAVFRYFEK